MRMQVKADGSCWVYSVLAGLDQLEHTTPLPWGKKQWCKDVTAEDQKLDFECRKWIADNNPNDPLFVDVLKVPDYSGKRRVDDFLGSFGNAHHVQQLCKRFCVRCLEWNEIEPDGEVLLIEDDSFAFIPQHEALLLARETDVINMALSKDKDNHVNVYLRRK